MVISQRKGLFSTKHTREKGLFYTYYLREKGTSRTFPDKHAYTFNQEWPHRGQNILIVMGLLEIGHDQVHVGGP